MTTQSFEKLNAGFQDLSSVFVKRGLELPGAMPVDLAGLNGELEQGLAMFEGHLSDCLVALPNGPRIWTWEYEALEQLAKDNGKELSHIIHRSTLENGSVVEANFSFEKLSDISALSHFTSLKKLSLHDNQIKDLSPISNLKELCRLHVSDNKIEDISSLTCLLKLEELYISSNKIRDLRPLIKLPKLKLLWVSKDHLSSKSRKILDELRAREGFKLVS